MPDNSNEVTKQIIYLLLRDWNEYHEVKRVSSYSNFYIEKKVDFLINFAYFINYRETQNNKRFSHNDLLFAYKSICEKFELPLEDAEKVINEIESHTGIIIKLFGNLFEFSHLVLQEYLCGEYLVKQPLSQELAKNFIQDPNPIAIAVTLSSERSLFFSNLFLNQNVSPAIWSNPSSVIKFLTRLNLENPRFEQRFMLGIAVMSLYFEMKKFDEVLELLNKLSSRKEILNSIKEAMDYYTLEKAPIVASKNLLLFTRNTKGKIAYYNLYLPYQVALNGDLYNIIIN